jgi:hypothetical protein
MRVLSQNSSSRLLAKQAFPQRSAHLRTVARSLRVRVNAASLAAPLAFRETESSDTWVSQEARPQADQQAHAISGRTAPLGTAIIVGASVAGLISARALAPSFKRVIVLDRDKLPDPNSSAGLQVHVQSDSKVVSGSLCVVSKCALPLYVSERARKTALLNWPCKRCLERM